MSIGGQCLGVYIVYKLNSLKVGGGILWKILMTYLLNNNQANFNIIIDIEMKIQ